MGAVGAAGGTDGVIALRPPAVERVVAIGAHCDDIAIGAGGSLLALCSARPGVRVDALVLAGGGTEREAEERTALAAFCPGADLRVSVGKIPDGLLPAHWEEAKGVLRELSQTTDPDVIFGPHPGDAHQDHRALAELIPTEFRGHLVLGYEIVKWDGDLGRPNAFQPLPPELAARKVDLLHELYPSQRHRSWFDAEAFRGLARIRGIECGARYAEAFYTSKLTVELGV